MIYRCTCKHEQQDKMHGQNMRVFNRVNKKATPTYRCTVCSLLVEVGGKK